MKRIIFLWLVISVCLCVDGKTITGRIIDDVNFEPQLDVYVFLNDSVIIDTTNIDGFFTINVNDTTKDIWLYGLCVYPTKIELCKQVNDTIEIIMLARYTYCFKTPREVERIIKSRTRHLPSKYKKAKKLGIIKEYPCFIQKYVPIDKILPVYIKANLKKRRQYSAMNIVMMKEGT